MHAGNVLHASQPVHFSASGFCGLLFSPSGCYGNENPVQTVCWLLGCPWRLPGAR